MTEVVARAPLHASEDEAKVRRALLNIFPDARVEREEGALVARTDSLASLRTLIRRQKILDAARKSLLRGLDATRTQGVFRLNKQAAFRGRVSFSDAVASPLGDLVVEARDADLEARFKEMAPMTIRGIPVSEERAEEELARRRARRGAAAPEPDPEEELAWGEEEGPAAPEAEETP